MSVLTLVKNRHAHLLQLLEGLRRCDPRPDEIIIVDMDDDLESMPDVPFAMTRLHRPGQGLALARARNLAARHARYDRLLFLDVDCIPMHRLVGAMTTELAGRDAVICAEIRYLGPGDARGRWEEAALRRMARGHPVRDFPAAGAAALSNPGLFWSLAFGIRLATFERLAGFDEMFTGYGAEDTDFGFRAHGAGVGLALLGGAQAGVGAFHQHHGVFNPPLQHFDDIVRNAALFRARWNVWPMQGWLQAFARLGLIEMSAETIAIIRPPRPDELRLAECGNRYF